MSDEKSNNFGVKLNSYADWPDWHKKALSTIRRKGWSWRDGRRLTATDNEKAIGLLGEMCGSEALDLIIECRTVQEAWELLERNFNKPGFHTNFIALKQFYDMDPDDYNSLEEFIFTMRRVSREVEKKELTWKDQVMSMTLKLLEKRCEAFASMAIESLKRDSSAYTPDTLFESLLDEARGRGDNQLLTANLSGRRRNNGANSQKYCNHCKKRNHIARDCFLLHPDKAPNNWKRKQSKVEKKKSDNSNGKPRKSNKSSSSEASETTKSSEQLNYMAAEDLDDFDNLSETEL